MTSKSALVGITLLVISVTLLVGASVRAQEPLRQDALGALLVEVRSLRTAVEQMLSATARIQLATGRLQIQEQRVNGLARQLFEVRQSLITAERENVEQEASLADLESVLPTTTDAGERRAVAERIGQLKTELTAAAGALQRLRTDESELVALVSAERGRWTELNQQLDALDQTLRRP